MEHVEYEMICNCCNKMYKTSDKPEYIVTRHDSDICDRVTIIEEAKLYLCDECQATRDNMANDPNRKTLESKIVHP